MAHLVRSPRALVRWETFAGTEVGKKLARTIRKAFQHLEERSCATAASALYEIVAALDPESYCDGLVSVKPAPTSTAAPAAAQKMVSLACSAGFCVVALGLGASACGLGNASQEHGHFHVGCAML